MKKINESFLTAVHRTVTATRIVELLRSKPAVILERIAKGGGATNWYYCNDETKLEAITSILSPGSVVSFYFDDRIRKSRYTPELITEIQSSIQETGEVVVGFLATDLIHIEASVVVSHDELVELMSSLTSSVELFYGVFPARDNDGVSAITLQLPDLDGVTRSHPH